MYDPGTSCDAENGADVLASTDVDVGGEEDGEVVAYGGGVGGDVGGDGG